MVIRGLIAGVIATVLLVAVLASARLFDMAEEEVLITMNDVEVIEMLPPPPPPEFSEPEPEEQQEEEPPPPAPSLDVPLDIPAPDVPTIAPSLTKVNLSIL